jgi:hypothetical protein
VLGQHDELAWIFFVTKGEGHEQTVPNILRVHERIILAICGTSIWPFGAIAGHVRPTSLWPFVAQAMNLGYFEVAAEVC